MIQGERLRELRKQRNFTLQEFALQTGLSPSLLSQIERGLVDPTVSTFWKICSSLSVPLHYFFEGVEEDELVVRKQQRRLIQLSDEKVKYHELTPNRSGKLDFLMVEIEPGVMSEAELVSHTGEECGIVLQGELIVILGEKEIHLHEGDSIHFSSTTPHRYINSGKSVSVSIWAMTSM
ncbi:cupin domain-containing protein [Fictibacillus sp. KIGAM418]|uniref:Cupin domain-containing protein n=1 Tax=Fictibacillus marinisediminis TaxID=2878389 RepID=A0A9X1XDM8_9BACL|nr:cupin domain-containing protein [Fictibacillus marinisediminis]MCK6258932.1 cupin domain-containing protein [Fictibacillus marinisediminis]